jgi:hypothetical protein
MPFVDALQLQAIGRQWPSDRGNDDRWWPGGFEVRGLGFGVWGSGFGVWGSGFGVWGSEFGVRSLGFGVWGLGFAHYSAFLTRRWPNSEPRTLATPAPLPLPWASLFVNDFFVEFRARRWNSFQLGVAVEIDVKQTEVACGSERQSPLRMKNCSGRGNPRTNGFAPTSGGCNEVVNVKALLQSLTTRSSYSKMTARLSHCCSGASPTDF